MYNTYAHGGHGGMGVSVGGLTGGMDALESYIALQNQVQDAMSAISVGGQGTGVPSQGTGAGMGGAGGALLEQQMRLNQLQQLQQLQNQIFQQQVRRASISSVLFNLNLSGIESFSVLFLSSFPLHLSLHLIGGIFMFCFANLPLTLSSIYSSSF